VAVLVLEDRDERNQTWAIAGRSGAGAEPVSSVAGPAGARRADSAIAVGAGCAPGGDAWRQPHRHGAWPRLLRFEEPGRGGLTAVERPGLRRVAVIGHGRQAVSA